MPGLFYRNERGSEPVGEWLQAFSVKEKKIIGTDIATLEYGWPIGMPLCRSLKNGLWEIRTSLPSQKIARIIFCTKDNKIILLHAFIKKSQKTPKADLELALQRKKEL